MEQAEPVITQEAFAEQDRNRVSRECKILAASRRDIEAGHVVTWAEAKAWLIARESDPTLVAPVPYTPPASDE